MEPGSCSNGSRRSRGAPRGSISPRDARQGPSPRALGAPRECHVPPLPDASFDVTCSFKVLAHVEAIEQAIAEMTRVTRPDGTVIAEFYNPLSLRALVKRLGPARAISSSTHEGAVFTRFDSPSQVKKRLPVGWEIVASRGVRIVTPTAFAMRVPGLRSALRASEWALADSPLSRFGGFWIAAIARRG